MKRRQRRESLGSKIKNREFSRALQKSYVSLDLIRMTGSDWLRGFFDTTLISGCSELNIITNNGFVLEDSYCLVTLFHSLRTVIFQSLSTHLFLVSCLGNMSSLCASKSLPEQ